ncbi:MAG: hypothetical protein LBK27_06930, partial [Treponema sp.]|nr:hypothetical protein [Treponema sp.]
MENPRPGQACETGNPVHWKNTSKYGTMGHYGFCGGRRNSLYKPVDPRVNFPQLEEEVLAFWEKNHIFEQSV